MGKRRSLGRSEGIAPPGIVFKVPDVPRHYSVHYLTIPSHLIKVMGEAAAPEAVAWTKWHRYARSHLDPINIYNIICASDPCVFPEPALGFCRIFYDLGLAPRLDIKIEKESCA